jgi:hypothetical protein
MIHDTWADRYSEACDRIDQLNDTIVALRAELAQFRAVTIAWGNDYGLVGIDNGSGNWDELQEVTVPLKVYVKGDHA